MNRERGLHLELDEMAETVAGRTPMVEVLHKTGPSERAVTPRLAPRTRGVELLHSTVALGLSQDQETGMTAPWGRLRTERKDSGCPATSAT